MNYKCGIIKEKKPYSIIQLPVKTIAFSVMLLMAVILLIPCTVLAEGGFAGGLGTEEDPWLIETPEQLATVAEAVYRDDYFKLIDDIDLSDYLSEEGDGWNEGAGWKPIGTQAEPFTGSFDGGEEGYAITGLYINRPGTLHVGMFGYTGNSAEIRNLRLENVDVVGNGYVGSVVGLNNGIIENSCATGDVEGIFYVGGLAGLVDNVNSVTSNSYTMVDVVGEDDVGGLTGMNLGTIENSCATGIVRGHEYVGGLSGSSGGIITNSSAAGDVSSIEEASCIGGLVGYSWGAIENSFATGDAYGITYVGGLVALNGGVDEGIIENSYATGAVMGSEYVGGLVGANRNSSTVSNSYAVGYVIGDGFYGGLAGENSDSSFVNSYYDKETTCLGQGVGTGDDSGVTDLSTLNMKLENSYTDWDFTNTWNIVEGTYPYLKWQANNFDFAPPVFSAGYPKTENITYEGMDILVQVDEDATAYYVVLADGENAPDAARIKAGMDSENTVLAENLKGSIAGLSAGADGTAAITGLAPGTDYDIYVVAEDTAGNMQPDGSVALAEACTGLMPTGDMDFDLTIPDPEAFGNSIAVDQSSPKSVDVNTVNGIESVVITGTKTAAQSVTLGGADAGKVTAAGGATEPAYTVDTSAIAAEGGTYEFTLTVSEAGKADIVYNVTVTAAVPDTTPPVPGSDGTITVSNVAHNSLELSWTAAADDVTIQPNLQYKVVRSESNNIDTAINAEANGTIVKDWMAGLTGTEASGLNAETIYYFNVIVRDEAGNMAVYHTESQTTAAVGEREDEDDRDEDDRRERNISDASPVYNAVITGSNASETTLSINVNTRTGSAAVNLGEKLGDALVGEEAAVITMPSIPGVNAYTVGISADSLSSSQSKDILTFSTPEGSITLPADMLEGIGETSGKEAAITIGRGNKSLLPDDVKAVLGDRPLVQLSLTLDGNQVEWDNPDAPVTVSIPYKPTAAELSDPEHITVWYIDGSGNVVSVPNGRYDPGTGNVIFTTTHFSHYAVAYVTKSFNDLDSVAWAKKPIQVLASKGILKGISETEYAPQINITRADFLYFMVRTLGFDAKVEGNFDDISSDAYYYREIGTGKKLGITGGTGNNKFSPDESITRQDMMVLTERALRMLKKLEVQGSASELGEFSDKSLVADYAVDGVASIIKEGLIIGSGGRINPLGSTTRAEAAMILYRIYNRFYGD